MSKANKIKLVVFSLLLFSGMVLNVHSAHAFFDVPFAIMGTQLDALDFIDNSLLRYMTLLAFLLVQGIVLLLFSANFLEWAAAYPIGLGPDNLLVNRGWEITSHLTNMLFILIFLAIAIAYILKLETFGMKKALPRLIIIALLTNFSLLFTKMIVDIGWVTQNSFFNIFFGGNQGFATTALQPLMDNLSAILGFLTADLAWFVGFALVPGLNVAKTAFLALWFFTMGGWGLVSEAVVFTVFSLSAGLIFLAYALFFLFRIAVIWILAILAPLAFAAYILPSTEKFFKQWLHTLIQWLLFGIETFFLLGLGLSLFGVISGKSVLIEFTGTQPWSVPGELSKFLFLLVYLVVVFTVARKTAPMGADMLWNLSSMATKKFGQWSGSKMGASLSRTQDWIRESAREHLPQEIGKWGERQALTPTWGEGVGGLRGALMRGVSSPFYRSRRAIGMAIGPTATRLEKEKMAQIEKSIGADEGLPELLKRYRETQDNATRIAVLNTIIKRKKIDDAMDITAFARRYNISPAAASGLVLTNQEVEKRMEAARSLGVDGTMKAAFPNIARQSLPIGIPPTTPPPGTSQAQHNAQYVFDGIKPTDYENMSKSVLKDDEFVEALIRKGKSTHLRQFIDRFGMDGSHAIEKRIKALADTPTTGISPKDWLKAVNPGISKYIQRGAGADLFDLG